MSAVSAPRTAPRLLISLWNHLLLTRTRCLNVSPGLEKPPPWNASQTEREFNWCWPTPLGGELTPLRYITFLNRTDWCPSVLFPDSSPPVFHLQSLPCFLCCFFAPIIYSFFPTWTDLLCDSLPGSREGFACYFFYPLLSASFAFFCPSICLGFLSSLFRCCTLGIFQTKVTVQVNFCHFNHLTYWRFLKHFYPPLGCFSRNSLLFLKENLKGLQVTSTARKIHVLLS